MLSGGEVVKIEPLLDDMHLVGVMADKRGERVLNVRNCSALITCGSEWCRWTV